MKKFKLFLVRNYQRFIRFLISFSAIGCILVSSFAVGAVTSFTPTVGAPTYLSVNTSDGETLVYTSDEPNGATFGVSVDNINQFHCSTKLSEPYPVITSLVQRIPFSFSVPDDSYFQGDFVFMTSVTLDGISYSKFDDISFSLYCSDGSVIPLSWKYRFVSYNVLDVSIPLTKTAEYIDISFEYFSPVSSASLRALSSTFNFKSSNFVYGSSQEFANSNISAFLDVISTFFSQVVSFLSSCLAIIVASPALTVLCLAMPICGFSVLLLRRFIHT